jgi:pre-60S factor REI1
MEGEGASVMKCNTCFAAFGSLELIKDHYRTEWHCLNAKRRGQGLTPLKRDQFLAFQSQQAKKQSQQPPKALTKLPAPPVVKKVEAPVPPPPASVDDSVSKEKADDNEEEEEDNDEEDENTTSKPQREQPLGPTVSVFDDKEFDSVDDCVAYMTEKFGFFIPDLEYLTDLEGLITYLNEKVKLGQICLYCQKRFSSGYAVQNHMISKSHCKIAYDNDIDGEEYEDFYDFSSTYEDVEDVELDEDGNPVDEEMEVTRTGELQLPDGRLLGHRQFRVYYKQYYRPTDTRAPVLAQQREELLRLGYKFGGSEWDVAQVQTMSDTDVMTNIIKYQKQIRKGQLVEQKAIKRKDRMDQRRLYNRTVDQLRSSENTTAKIRDYHRMLV